MEIKSEVHHFNSYCLITKQKKANNWNRRTDGKTFSLLIKLLQSLCLWKLNLTLSTTNSLTNNNFTRAGSVVRLPVLHLASLPYSTLLWEVFPRVLRFFSGYSGFSPGTPVFPRVLRFSPLTKNLNLIREPKVCQRNCCWRIILVK